MPQFRDPIHGFVFVSEDEQKIVNSTPFQRLRNIHQLATTYLVYHGAEHTRFGHSIGVMHLVTKAFESVVSKSKNLFRADSKENEAVIKWYRQILRLMALTHDLGHAPFSHGTEELFPQNFKHEDYTKKIIEETEIAGYIKEIGEKLQIEIANEFQISPDELVKKHKIHAITPQLICMIHDKKPSLDKMVKDEFWPDFVFLKSFMDSELDCDKMDYLLRDSLYCGVTYGKYDLDRFVSTLTVYENNSKTIRSLAIGSGGVQAFEEFVLARYFMFIQVYFHKTRRYLDGLLIKCLKELLPNGKYPENVEEYLKWDDIRVINEMRQAQTVYVKQYLEREVMSCVYETPAHASDSENKLVQMWLEQMQEKFPESPTYFDEVGNRAHGLLPTIFSLEKDSEHEIKVIDKQTREPKNIMDYSLILQGIIKKIYICRIYAGGSRASEIKQWISEKNEKYSKR